MKLKSIPRPQSLAGLLAVLCLASVVLAQTTAFTYQGRLTDGGNPASGIYDLQFRLFDALAGGNQLGMNFLIENVSVTNGIFSVMLDFGTTAFPGANRFLEIGVRPGPSTGAFTPLAPLQLITATPYAIKSLGAATADGLSVACVNCVTSSQINSINSNQLSLPLSLNANSGSPIVSAVNSGEGNGVFASTAGSNGRGVHGFAISTTGTNFGVFGQSNSSDGTGVFGSARSATGQTYGVRGESDSSNGVGISGVASSPNGATLGVYGQSNASVGRGVVGYALSATGETYGVEGRSNSSSGTGMFGEAVSTTGQTFGVHGESHSNSGTGVYGFAKSFNGANFGVFGQSNSFEGLGVYGLTVNGGGTAFGVRGDSHSSAGRGVFGFAASTTGVNYGVYGQSLSPSGAGVRAQGSGTNGTALQIESGAIKVPGAGVGTSTTVFIHRATVANISGSNTVIDHALTNGDANAILIVTPNWNPGGLGGTNNAHQIGVIFNLGRWRIFNEDDAAMPVNSAYNVLIVKP